MWSEDTQVPRLWIGRITVGSDNYRLHLHFFQGGNSDGSLWYSAMRRKSDVIPSVRVPNASIYGSPCAVLTKPDEIYVYYSGRRDSSRLYYAVVRGQKWRGPVEINALGITGAPGVVHIAGKNYVFHQGGNNNEELWYSVFNT